MSIDAERRAQRRNTQAFIASRAFCIALIPSIKTKTASGYTTSAGEPRREQFFALIDQSTTYGNVPGKLRSSEAGQRKIDHQLLGYWDADMEVGDHWDDGRGGRYEIDEMLPDNGYERRAKVIRYGSQ